MQKYQDVVLNQNGNPIAGAEITVTNLLGTPVPVYASNGVGLNVTPVRSDADGRFFFYAPDGRYNLVVRFGGNIMATVTDILLEDPQDGSDVVFNDVTVLGELSDASKIASTPTGTLSATDVQSALEELEAEKASIADLASPAAGKGAEMVAYQPAGVGAVATTVEARLQAYEAPGGAGLLGYQPAGTGAVATNVQSKLREMVSVKDFGAVGNGVADDTAAINAALAAIPVGGGLRFPAGTYRVTSQIAIPSGKRLALLGEGSRQTVLTYAGANTAVDCFVFGNGSSDCNGYLVQGISFSSSTLMTAGAGVRFRRLNRSRLIDVLFGHQDGNSNFYHGAWFDAADMVDVTGFQARAQQDAIRINGGSGGRADLYLTNGKIAQSSVAVHVGGDFGGLYIDSVSIINNATNILIDQSIVAVANRECFFGPGCLIDSADSTGTASIFDGLCVDIQDTGGFVLFNNSWIASCSTAIRTGASFAGTLQIDGGIIFNCFNTFGGNGNAIEIGNTNATVIVSGTRFANVDGTAILCTAGNTSNVILRSPTFASDVNVRFNSSITPRVDAISPALVSTSQYVFGKTVGGHTAPIASATDGSPAHTFATAASVGGASHFAHYTSDVSGGFINISKSRASTIGSHAAVIAGDVLGTAEFSGSDGTAYRSAAQVRGLCAAISGSTVAGELQLRTRDVSNNMLPSLVIESGHHTRPGADNVYLLGTAGNRWSVVFAGTGTINTSDAREKQDIETLTAAELRVATALKGLVKKFRFKDAVQAKGDAARIHVGVIAQEVIAAFQDEGLDATRYGVICYDEWDEKPAQFDEEGNVMQEYRPAGSRYGVRYEELLAFIIAAL